MVTFPHALHRTITDELFVAAWIVWFARNRPAANWRTDAMPRGNQAVGLAGLLQAPNPLRLDLMCRYLVPPQYRNTMHATNPFMELNAAMVSHAPAVNHAGQTVNGAKLTAAACAMWDALPDDRRLIALADAEALFDSDIELMAGGGQATELLAANRPEIAVVQPAVQSVPLAHNDLAEVAGRLVDQIGQEPHQRYYRRRPFGNPVTGWSERLSGYFWPNPRTGLAESAERVDELCLQLEPLARAVDAQRPWTQIERTQAVAAAHAVFDWGGVPQGDVTPGQVHAVLASALSGAVQGAAPMNSGWTKVAALGTAWLEAEGRTPMVIWDSRVATALTWRLDRLLMASGLTPNLQSIAGLGYVNGRGGTRPRHLQLRWPNGYQSWGAQFAATRLVFQMRNELNRRQVPMPLPNGGTAEWTVRGVEQVLFMDGY
jgi:hypothetical protein